MDFLETLLKYADVHAKTIIVSLIAVMAVGAVGGGISIHNLRDTVESQAALRKQQIDSLKQEQSSRIASITSTLYELEKRVNVLDETVKEHEVFLDQTNSRLKQVARQVHSTEVKHEIEQIADDLTLSKERLGTPRAIALRSLATTRSNLTGLTQRPPPRRPNFLVPAIIVAILLIALVWIVIRIIYKRSHRRRADG